MLEEFDKAMKYLNGFIVQNPFLPIPLFRAVYSTRCSRLVLTLFLGIATAGLMPASGVYAEDKNKLNADASADESITVSVRAIHATKSRGPNSPVKPNNFTKSKKYGENQGQIRDIKAKLKKLPYNNFDLISHQSKAVAFDQQETFVLGDGNVLNFKTISKKKDKVCLWLNWKDGKGANVLDTRLHFVDGETVLTGSDLGDDTGLIVAIDVK